MKSDRRKITWAIQRMRRIVIIWRKLDSIDREFLLDKFKSEYPMEFWKVVNRVRP